MATQSSVIYHQWSAAGYATAAAIETAYAAIESGQDFTEALDALAETARKAINLYDTTEEMTDVEVISLAPRFLGFAEAFRKLLDFASLPTADPVRQIYDQFAERAEDLALSACQDWKVRRLELLAEAQSTDAIDLREYEKRHLR